MIEQYKYIVRVDCVTFNHVNYIEDAMNGFTMQETSFPFVCTIIDDASTDGEQGVIKKYLEEHFDLDDKTTVRNEETDDYTLTFAQHKTNKKCFFAVLYLKYNHYSIKKSKDPYIKEWQDNSKYFASCEGDDYWTHPQKLQMQYEALEAHPECSICFGITECISNKGNSLNEFIPKDLSRLSENVTLEDFCREQFSIGQWTFHTSSFFFRKSVNEEFSKYMKDVFKDFPYSDICIILTGLILSSGFFIKEKMSNYRILSGGFNSRIKANPQMAISVEEQLIKGMEAFDQYTNYKYHNHVKNRILRSRCIIDYRKEGNNGLVFLKPKYWKIAKMQGTRTTTLMALQTLMPRTYYFLKKLLKGE